MATQEQIDKNPEITGDELGKLSQESLIQTCKDDIETIKKNIEQIKKIKQNHLEQLEIDKKIFAKLSNKETYKKIEPTFIFEDDEYWELQFEKNQYKIRENLHIGDRTQEGYDKQLELSYSDLKDKEERLVELEKGE